MVKRELQNVNGYEVQFLSEILLGEDFCAKIGFDLAHHLHTYRDALKNRDMGGEKLSTRVQPGYY